ncbi:hypothetical protein Drose_27415 [Dactylosporangium roseum]|uniref:RNA polymerase sigma-70 region 2 domain-containing protein n=1 Tax=Dactylosporangium roseum TaxID=47989 RepID=A0ABY5Z1Z9_9ACTN|nr:hypothetical protein Drose_27415 [Dactylosporangium roseum]
MWINSRYFTVRSSCSFRSVHHQVGAAARGSTRIFEGVDFRELFERHRRELHVHCYRMLASFEEADDAVQETFLRAWRHRDGFEPGVQARRPAADGRQGRRVHHVRRDTLRSVRASGGTARVMTSSPVAAAATS